MKTGLWQPETIQGFVTFLEPNPAVKTLILVGSNAQGTIDPWSDVDLVCVVDDSHLEQFYPGTEWLTALGTIFGLEQSSAPFKSVTRICFDDFQRVDLIFMLESVFQHPQNWDYSPLEARVFFSRSPVVDEAIRSQSIAQSAVPEISLQEFEKMAQQFWFKATVAVTKVMRNDLLIGLHLALDLGRDCLVLAMIARDLETGTNIHTQGGPYNEIVEQVGIGSAQLTPQGILDLISQAAATFDALAVQLSPGYPAKASGLQVWINHAREGLSPSQ